MCLPFMLTLRLAGRLQILVAGWRKVLWVCDLSAESCKNGQLSHETCLADKQRSEETRPR